MDNYCLFCDAEAMQLAAENISHSERKIYLCSSCSEAFEAGQYRGDWALYALDDLPDED